METALRLLVGQFMKRDQRECVRTQSRGVLKAQVTIQLRLFPFAIIPLLAGNLARPASNTLRDVDQGSFDGDRG
jgi:hypothetical protein